MSSNVIYFLVAQIYKISFWVCFLHAFAYVNVGHLKVHTFFD